MPATPFHFGPGAVLKALLPRHFSFTVFCLAQVVTDCEVAYYLMRGDRHIFIGFRRVGLDRDTGARPPVVTAQFEEDVSRIVTTGKWSA